MGVVGDIPSTFNPVTAEGAVAKAVATMTEARGWFLHPVTLDPTPEVLAAMPSLDNGGIRPNEDGTVTVRYRIDPEATWSDGTPITGADLRETARQFAEDGAYALILSESWIVGHRAVEFTLTAPTIDYLDLFALVVPAHVVAGTDVGSDWISDRWPGAGPFVVAETAAGEVTLTANDRYWRLDPETGLTMPLLDSVRVLAYPDTTSLAEAVVEGDVDVAELGIDYGLVVDEESGPLVAALAAGNEYEHLAFQRGDGRFDRNPRSMNASPTYRTFVASLIDRDAIIELVDGVDGLYSITGSSWPSAGSDAWADVETPASPFATIADDLGYDFGERPPEVRLTTTNSLLRTLVAGVITQELAANGVLVDVSLVDPGLFFLDLVIPGEYDLAQWAWESTPGPIGAVADLRSRFGDPDGIGELNFYRWDEGASPIAGEVEALLGELDTTMDLGELSDMLLTIDELLAEDMVVIPLFQVQTGAVYDEEAVNGVDMPLGGLPVAEDAATWLVPPQS